jgi:NTE family protein
MVEPRRFWRPFWLLALSSGSRYNVVASGIRTMVVRNRARKEEKVSTIDLVFEGGGAKGFAFVGALDVLFGEHDYTYGRLLGTSAGAITAVLLAAGYTTAELLETLTEKDDAGLPVFTGFLADPTPFDQEEIRYSVIRQWLQEIDIPLLLDQTEDRMDDWIAEQIATRKFSRHIFSFLERGGWYSADPFVVWLQGRLEKDRPDGSPRAFGHLTLQEFFEATGVELSLVAADTWPTRRRPR